MKKRLLIAGGSHSDIPMIQAAQKMGYHVITSGNRKEDLGHHYSDEVHLEDFSNKEAMLELAKKLNIDAICSSSNDFSVITSAYIAEQLKLPGHDTYKTTLLLHHKDKYREFAIKHGINSPQAKGFKLYEDAIAGLKDFSFPLIIKPIDLTGGKGITKVYSKEEAYSALQQAFERSHAKRIVIEEFIEGTLHSCSTFINKDKVIFYFNDNEYSYLNPYLVSTSSSPALVSDKVQNELCQLIEKMASTLSLQNGLLHLQYLVRDNIPYIIEFTRRMPGDFYAKPVQYSTGLDYASWVVKASTGQSLQTLTHKSQQGFYSRHCVMSIKEGIIKDIIFDDRIKSNIIDTFMWWEEGDNVADINTYKAGIIFLKFDSQEEMIEKVRHLNELVFIEMEESI